MSNVLILENSGLKRGWGGRAAMRSPAEKNFEVSGFIRVRIPSPPLPDIALLFRLRTMQVCTPGIAVFSFQQQRNSP